MPSFPMPGSMHKDFGVPKRASSFNNNLLYYLLISPCACSNFFYQPGCTPETSFQTVENHLPDWASIFGQLTFYYKKKMFSSVKNTTKMW